MGNRILESLYSFSERILKISNNLVQQRHWWSTNKPSVSLHFPVPLQWKGTMWLVLASKMWAEAISVIFCPRQEKSFHDSPVLLLPLEGKSHIFLMAELQVWNSLNLWAITLSSAPWRVPKPTVTFTWVKNKLYSLSHWDLGMEYYQRINLS